MKRTLLAIFLILLAARAHGAKADWTFSPYDYQYDMTLYVALASDPLLPLDLERFQVGAFCGDECRGKMEVRKVEGKSYGYLRVWSRRQEGDAIVFRILEKETGQTYACDSSLVFSSQALLGLPSVPYILHVQQVTGDINQDEFLTISDVTTLVSMLQGKAKPIPAADLNHDGLVNRTDLQLLVNRLLRR